MMLQPMSMSSTYFQKRGCGHQQQHLLHPTAAGLSNFPSSRRGKVMALEHHPATLIKTFYSSYSVIYSKQKKIIRIISIEILYT